MKSNTQSQAEHYQRYKPRILAEKRNDAVKWVNAVCPSGKSENCPGEYKVRMFWSGRGTPRIMCEHCKNVSKHYADIGEHRVSAPGV